MNISNIPNLNKKCLHYIFEDLKIKHEKDSLWLEFGVYTGNSIRYIASHTDEIVYGFDSFEGLPEKWRDGYPKGAFKTQLPIGLPSNVKIIEGLFQDTLSSFLESNSGKVSFIHMDADLYSSTKYVLNTLTLHERISKNCIILFDEFINFPGYDSSASELRALKEWVSENPKIKWKWIGMNGKLGDIGPEHEQACLMVM